MHIVGKQIAFSLIGTCALWSCTASEPEQTKPGQPVNAPGADHSKIRVSDLPKQEDMGYRLEELKGLEFTGDVTADTCAEQEFALAEQACSTVSPNHNCSGMTTFFYAHQVPRCALRVWIAETSERRGLPPIVRAADFSGDAIVGPAPLCGNGELDDGETCDDGNRELWDGCDSHCNAEPFNGCEAVIEDYYESAGIAKINKDHWLGPRSHMMIHPSAQSLVTVTPTSCSNAKDIAHDVCSELQSAMPFVGYCQPHTTYHTDVYGSACSIRLNIGFSGIHPETGVYSTALPGILAFTLR